MNITDRRLRQGIDELTPQGDVNFVNLEVGRTLYMEIVGFDARQAHPVDLEHMLLPSAFSPDPLVSPIPTQTAGSGAHRRVFGSAGPHVDGVTLAAST